VRVNHSINIYGTPGLHSVMMLSMPLTATVISVGWLCVMMSATAETRVDLDAVQYIAVSLLSEYQPSICTVPKVEVPVIAPTGDEVFICTHKVGLLDVGSCRVSDVILDITRLLASPQ
jgi:hypothetical protein